MAERKRTIVYIDGFNLYYRALKGTPYKWLDLDAFCRKLLPKSDIVRVKYFTARVSARPNDPEQPTRQQMYLRALATLPNLDIIEGSFLSNAVRLPRVVDRERRTLGESVLVYRTEEKGSDVNLASHLLTDACRGAFEVAVIVSNDSDFLLPITMVQEVMGKPVGVAYPSERISPRLKEAASFVRKIRRSVLRDCQFPPTLKDTVGVIRKPKGW